MAGFRAHQPAHSPQSKRANLPHLSAPVLGLPCPSTSMLAAAPCRIQFCTPALFDCGAGYQYPASLSVVTDYVAYSPGEIRTTRTSDYGSAALPAKLQHHTQRKEQYTRLQNLAHTDAGTALTVACSSLRAATALSRLSRMPRQHLTSFYALCRLHRLGGRLWLFPLWLRLPVTVRAWCVVATLSCRSNAVSLQSAP